MLRLHRGGELGQKAVRLGGLALGDGQAAEGEGGAQLNADLAVQPGLIDGLVGVDGDAFKVPGRQGVLRQDQGLAAGAAALHRLGQNVEVLGDEIHRVPEAPGPGVVGVEQAVGAIGEFRLVADEAGVLPPEKGDRLDGVLHHGAGIVEGRQDPGVVNLPQDAGAALLLHVHLEVVPLNPGEELGHVLAHL